MKNVLRSPVAGGKAAPFSGPPVGGSGRSNVRIRVPATDAQSLNCVGYLSLVTGRLTPWSALGIGL